MIPVYQFYKEILGMRDEDLIGRLMKHTQHRHLHRGNFLMQSGEKIHEFYFLIEGCIIGSTLQESGEYKIECIENRIGTVCVDFLFHQNKFVSTLDIWAGTDSEFYTLPAGTLYNAILHEADAKRVHAEMVNQALNRQWNVSRIMINHDAKERYQWFLNEYPALEEHLNDRVIASYLCMSPVTLSRLRSALRYEN